MPDKSVSLSVVRGLTASEVGRLQRAGVDNTKELLAAAKTPAQERALAQKAGISLDRTREAVNRADLIRLPGMGPATADLFENAGVNSVKELAQRNAASLAALLATYVKTHPELNYRLPSPTTVASLVAKARAMNAPAPVTDRPAPTIELAREPAKAAIHKYIDEVLFSNHPDGASFRENVLDWRPSTEKEQVQARMHAGVDAWSGVGNSPDGSSDGVIESPASFFFTGRLLGLHTEVEVNKATGKSGNLLVEID